jgi:hypothetical protein
MSGFNLAETGHLVQLWEPANHTGAESTLVVRMENYSHMTVIISYGATPAADGLILVESCDDMTPTTHTEIVFDYYECILDFEGALGDVMSVKKSAEVTGMVPTAVANIMYIIELEASQLTSGHIGFRLRQANPTGDSIMSAVAILSGSRYAGPASPTAIA